MSEPASHAHEPAEHGPNFQAYFKVFVALMICTIASFAAYEILGHGHTSMTVILAISIVKATLVAMIFMHLLFDWPKVYCIVIPVCIMAVMMMIVLLPDGVLGWHNPFSLYR